MTAVSTFAKPMPLPLPNQPAVDGPDAWKNDAYATMTFDYKSASQKVPVTGTINLKPERAYGERARRGDEIGYGKKVRDWSTSFTPLAAKTLDAAIAATAIRSRSDVSAQAILQAKDGVFYSARVILDDIPGHESAHYGTDAAGQPKSLHNRPLSPEFLDRTLEPATPEEYATVEVTRSDNAAGQALRAIVSGKAVITF